MDEQVSAAESAYRALRDAILEGEHRPGEMLGEAGLAASLGVSRTPVRAALGRLQDEGWITIYPKRGALVRGLAAERIAEHADARLVLETTAAARVHPDRRDAHASALDRSVREQEEAFRAGDLRSFIDLTLRFHRGFVEAGGSEVLLELYDRLADRHRFLLFAAGERLLGRCEEIIAEHRALVEYLRSGDAESFASVLRGHIAEGGPFGAEDLSVRGPLAAAREALR